MTTRYFKATDGKITVFRASKTKVYQSAGGFGPREWIRFSTYAANVGTANKRACIEIDKAEYDRLNAIKFARLGAANGIGPQDSWVENSEIEPACPACGASSLLQSQMDPADPYWYCTEENCDWTGYLKPETPIAPTIFADRPDEARR
jgi:hypothetical protein